MLQDLRYAARAMARNPGFTALAILALALGIGANTAVFTVLHGVLLRPLPFPEPERLQLLSYSPTIGPFGSWIGISEELHLAVQRDNRSFESIAAFNQQRNSLTGFGEPMRLQAAGVTTDFFKILRVQPALGRGFLPEDANSGNSPVVIVSDRLWRSRLASDTNVIGRVIQFDGQGKKVIGVMPAGFAFPYNADVWNPFEVRISGGNSYSRPVVVRLKPGVTREQALAEFQTITHRVDPEPSRRNPPLARVLPLKELLVRNIRESLWIFAGAVAFVLLIACANVANLLLMRAASRQQEIAVPAALGAGRWRLIRQLLTESTLVSLAGGAAGVLLALWGVPALLALAPAGRIPRSEDIRIDGVVLAFTLLVSVGTGVVFGLAPALHSTRRQIRDTLSLGARTVAARHGGLRNALAVAEIALSLVLLTGAGLMLKSFLRLRAVDPGFRPENVMTMTVDIKGTPRDGDALKQFHQRMLEKLAAAPGVMSAGGVNFVPMGGDRMRGDFQVQNGRLPQGYLVEKQVVSAGYFPAMGIRLLNGRDFSERDLDGAPRVAIISESVARTVWPGENPIGKLISENDRPKPEDWMTIAGVVQDIHQSDLVSRPVHALYFPYPQVRSRGWLSQMTYVVRTSMDPAAVAPAMRGALHEVDPNQPVESMVSMSDRVARTIAEPLFQARLLTLFALLAVALAAIGIYGVLAHSVASRTHEIGIRMALGAERGDVMRMVLRRTLILVGIGVAIGTAGALLATQVLEKLLFEVKPNDTATFVAVALTLVGVALVAGWIPARRATRVDPLVALRYE